MASPSENLGDVINLSSSDDEVVSSRKRSFRESENPQANDDSVHRPKRPKTESSVSPNTSGEGAEEGEVDEGSTSSQMQPAPQSSTDVQSGTQKPKDTKPTPDNQVETKTESSAPFVPSNGPVFIHGSLSFKLPVFSRKREGTWDDRFKDWVQVFCTTNAAHSPSITASVIQAAYGVYIDQSSGLKPKKKRSARQAAKAVQDRGQLKAILSTSLPAKASRSRANAESTPNAPPDMINSASDSKDNHEPTIENPLSAKPSAVPSAGECASLLHEPPKVSGDPEPPESHSDPDLEPVVDLHPNGANVSENPKTQPGGNALEQLQRYFPSATGADLTNLCLLCGRKGHTSATCSSISCKFCGSTEHWDFCCPTRTRCGRCRQLGHSSSGCTEKLALTKDEGLACCFCYSPDHLEEECTEIWRSFVPDADSIKAVVSIAASCSVCGGGTHYSSDCTGCRGPPGNPTWSCRNRDRYIDTECDILAIEEEASRFAGPQKSRAPDMRIRGHAARTANVHYSESDDSEVEFLGKKAPKKRGGLGQIRMASNIQMPNQRAQPSQPPLPPGPPPPGPPPRQGSFGRDRVAPGVQGPRSLPLGPPPSLPPKPPAPPRDYRSVPPPPPSAHSQGSRQWRGGQRGGRGGRGGGRGGRGRGRGKP